MGIKTILVILASLSLSATAFADDHEGGLPFKISGDFAVSTNFFDNENVGGSNHDDFSMDLTEINIEREWSNSRAFMSMVYGATALSVNAPGQVLVSGTTNPPTNIPALARTTLNLANAFYEMNTSYGLVFRVGKFESPVGHETYNIRENANYNRSYGFQLAPFFSTGAHLAYGADMWSAGFIVSNGSGMDTDTRDRNKTMAVVLDFDPMENFHIDLNYVTGTEGSVANTATAITILDVSLAYMINDMFDVALNYIDHGQKQGNATENKATSIAAYVNANLGMYSLGLRYEQLSYDYGVQFYNGLGLLGGLPTTTVGTPGTDNSISSITLTAKAEIDQNVHFVIEHKMDTSDDNGIWNDKDGNATDAQSVSTLGLMYTY